MSGEDDLRRARGGGAEASLGVSGLLNTQVAQAVNERRQRAQP